jgi:AcrR family transcriptional regulator
VTNPLRSRDDVLSGVGSLGGRGRPRALDREQALRAAMTVLDADGLGALTLRRLATDLGVGIATVHNTVGGKEALLQALADTVFATLPDADTLTAERPTDALVDYFTEVYRMLVGNPAIAQLTVLRRMRNPSYFRAQETVLELLCECGLDDQDAWDAYDNLTNYVFGYSLNHISRQDFDRHEAIADLPREQYPTVRRISPLFDTRTAEEQLQVCLRRILDAYQEPTGTYG